LVQLLFLNIQLPFEQRTNPYVKKSIGLHYFFTRKIMLTSPGNAFVFFPGGFGTLDELFEILSLNQLGYINKPCGLLNSNGYYDELLRFLETSIVNGFRSPYL
jgi:uncharacterized protein (TIGR00730 family)